MKRGNEIVWGVILIGVGLLLGLNAFGITRVELFFDGLIDKPEAIKRLRFEKPNLQFCFRSQLALSCLAFIKATRL